MSVADTLADAVAELDGFKQAARFEERKCANTALLASITIEQYLIEVDDIERPF